MILILLFSYIINKFITTYLYFSYINMGYFSFLTFKSFRYAPGRDRYFNPKIQKGKTN